MIRLDGLTMLTMTGPAEDPAAPLRGSLWIDDGRIAGLGPRDQHEALEQMTLAASFDCAGLVAIPGFVQGHVHCCQTLFRGLADDRPLMAWLRERIWPLEAAHDPASVAASAELSIVELLAGGTTCVQVMESVHHAGVTMEMLGNAGLAAIVGNCLMDVPGEGVPRALLTTAAEALRECERLHAHYHVPRRHVFYAVSPRFVLSCSAELAHDAVAFARQHGLRIHTHANEHRDEVALVERMHGKPYLEVLAEQGWLGNQTGLAHCVHTTAGERALLQQTAAAVLHCPSANLKLGSGIAPIADYTRRGLRVALGADGAACNNRLSALTELRTAALLQSVSAGPGAWPAAQALHAATVGGARALGLDHLVGSLEIGKRADLCLFDLSDLEPNGDFVSQIVWSATERHIRHVLLGGRFVVKDRELVALDAAMVRERAKAEQQRVLQRAQLRA